MPTDTAQPSTNGRSKPGGKGPMWFVQLLTGPLNTDDYSYLGVIGADGKFHLTKASTAGEDAKSVKAISYAAAHGFASPGVEVWHAGRCGRCGRLLTVPESLESGYGPECIGKLCG